MRLAFTTFLFSAFLIASTPTHAQDMAAQQAVQAAQQANMQASQAAQQASQQAMQNAQQANQQAMQNAQQAANNPCCYAAAAPKFSIAPGAYPADTIVRLKSRTRGTQIYYTTDGWSPTAQSTLYTGPITLTRSQTIQAIAIVPGYATSTVAKADYVVTNPIPQPALGPSPKTISPTEIELPRNAELPLVFTSKLDSQTAQVGDIVPLALASDLIVDGQVLAPKGCPATARVSAVDPAGHVSLPGVVTFTLVSINIHGVDVSLAGTKTRQGATHLGRNALFLIPVVGPATALLKGDPVQILPGTPVTALVAANTDIPLKP